MGLKILLYIYDKYKLEFMGRKATFLHEDKLTVLVRMSGDFRVSAGPQESVRTIRDER